MRIVLISSLIILLNACISYDDETEQKFQDNKSYLLSYLEEIGYKDSPFLSRLPSDQSDKQKKKMIALMSKEEIKTFVDRHTSGVPKINAEHPRTKVFYKEIESLKSQNEKYEILENYYPELIIK